MLSSLAEAVQTGLSSPRAAALLVVAGGLLRLAFVPFGAVLREDAFAYLLKAGEIARGNLVPMASHAIGWPLALAPFVGAAGRMPLDGGMAVARAVTLASALWALWLTSRLAHALLSRTSANAAVALAAFSGVLIYSASSGMAEPLFTALLLAAVLDVGRDGHSSRIPWLAGACTGLAWWVRPHGVILAAGLLLAVALGRKDNERRAAPILRAVVVLAVACITAAPAAIQRERAFGSPLTFGENDKILLASKTEHVWSTNVAPVSVRQFVTSMTPAVVVDRLLVRGVGRVAFQVAVYVVTPLLLPFAAWSAARRWRDPRFRPVLVLLVTWLVAMVPLAGTSSRHLLPIAPLALVLTADGVSQAMRLPRWRLVAAVAVAAFAVQSLALAAWYRHKDLRPEIRAGLAWGKWAADHLRGRLAIVEGGDLVMMHLPDTAVAGVGLTDFYAPRSGLRVTRPGSFDSLQEALGWMRAEGITHLAVDDDGILRRPYLREVRDPATRPPCLHAVEAGDFIDGDWPIRFFEVRWQECRPEARAH